MNGFLETQIEWKNKESLELKKDKRMSCKKCHDHVAHDCTENLGFVAVSSKLAKKIEDIYHANHHIFYEERKEDVKDSLPKWKTLIDGELIEKDRLGVVLNEKYDDGKQQRNDQTGQFRKDVLPISPGRKAIPKKYEFTENDPLPSQNTFISEEKLQERIEKKYYPSPGIFIPPLNKQRDVIIIGGGHNGLISAAYLAKKGLDVLLLEREM